MQHCCGAFSVPQQCTGTSDTQGVITTTNHFLVSVSSNNVHPPSPRPKLFFSSSSSPFLFPLSSAPYRLELVYISIRELGLELERGRVCVQADSAPPVPHTSPLKVEAAAQCRLDPCQSKALRPFMQISLSVVDQ